MYRVIILLVFVTSTIIAGEPDKVLHEKCLYPSIMILNNNPKALGSGIIIKSVKKEDKYENYALTCAHIIHAVPKLEKPDELDEPDEPEAIIDVYDVSIAIGVYKNWSVLTELNNYAAEVLVINYNTDIALIRFITEKNMPVAEIDKDLKLFIGNDVCRVGCGLSEPFRIEYGKINSVKNSIGIHLKGMYRVSIPTVTGDSGGAVFHENKVIGLTKAIKFTSIVKIPEFIKMPDFLAPVYNITYVIPIENFYSKEVMEYLKD